MKKNLLIPLLLFFSLSAFTQTVQELNKKVEAFFNDGKIDSSALVLEKVVYLLKKEKGENDSLYMASISDLAYLYSQLGEYDKTVSTFTHLINLRRKAISSSPKPLAYDLNNLGLYYLDEGQYEIATPLFFEAEAILKKLLPEEYNMYSIVINNIGMNYKYMGQYKKAEPYFIEANKIKLKTAGEESKTYALGLNNLASIYKDMGEYAKSEIYYLQATAITKKISGDQSADYATKLDNLSMLYSSMGEYKKAEEYGLHALAIRKKVLGEDNADYGRSLNNMGGIYIDKSQYSLAEDYFIQGAANWKKLLGEDHPLYANCLSNIARVYLETSRYAEAEKLFHQVREIRLKSLGQDHPDYISTLSNLAGVYEEMGQYGKAEDLYLQALAGYKISLDETHPLYITTTNNIAYLYSVLGQYNKAEKFYIKALELRKQVLGELHPDYATSLNNLAVFYDNSGNYEKAISLHQQALTIRQKVLGEDHQEYAASLDNLATLYVGMKEFKKAEELDLKALSIYKKIYGEENQDYARVLHNLAYLYDKVNDDTKAETYYLQACAIKKKIVGEKSPLYKSSLNNLALLYEKTGQLNKAEPLFIQANAIEKEILQNTFIALSEQEKLTFLSTQSMKADAMNSLLFVNKKPSSKYIQAVFDALLFYKSLTLSDSKSVLGLARGSKDTTVQRIYTQWKAGKSFLAKQYAMPAALRSIDVKKTEADIETLEKQMSLRSRSFERQQKELNVTVTDLQKYLASEEALIEFVRFREYNKGWTTNTRYAAYIITNKDAVPVFVPLCEERQLGKYFSSTSGNNNIKSIYRSDVVDEDEKPSISGDSLYALVWKPLLPYLQGIKKINYSPAGLLYKVAFHALPINASELLLDKYELNQFTSSRQLDLTKENTNRDISITLFGDCQFTMDSIAILKNIAKNENVSHKVSAPVAGNKGIGWKQLPGTADEIKNIQTLFEANKINTTSFSKVNATEESFIKLSGHSPKILHLATHGFFLPDPEIKKQEGFAADERNAFTLADDPLLRSGIVLSGANRVWSGGQPIAGREDGIVTAYEIAQMDLSNTDLVVLSACETALGDIKGNEGVFGLQRAFKLAGVKNMLLSLWKVPDAETADFMKAFYNNYLQGKTTRQSYSAAQKEMRKKYKPYYWAAFVLIE